MNYRDLYQKYEDNKNNIIFTKEQIANLLIKEFNAIEFPFTDILDLKRDNCILYNKIYKSFTIKDADILKCLFTKEEKSYHEEAKQYETQNTFSKLKKDIIYNQMIIDEQLGNRIDIILESKDGEYISAFEVRSQCEIMDRYLNALTVGSKIFKNTIDFNVDIHDEYFQFYLENLYRFGFLNN